MGQKKTQPRILVVDDDADILAVLKGNLSLYGFQVATADTKAGADRICREFVPDLVVLDRMLPDGDSVDLCSAWRAERPGLPVIFLTARDSVSDRVLGLDSGADDYVLKPFEPLELVARIKACLRRSEPAVRRGRMEFGPLVIDEDSAEVSMDGAPVDLTPKEYQLLCLLADNPGTALSREDIRRALWKDSKIYSWSRVIDVHVQHLRQKVEPDPAEPRWIKTIVGRGYRFDPEGE